ncbi:MAG TPA: EAL domain-containing protein [Burkholderiales bacterium]|nr:EAL domain-containing protein [Burkholderiales bacterium]
MAAAVLAAIGIALVTSLQSNLSERTVLASSVSQHEDYTTRVAADIDRQVRLARAALSELTGNITSAHLDDPAALHYFLTSRIGIQQNFESIAVFNVNGELIASRPSMEFPPVANESWFTAALRNNGTPTIREPFFSPLSGEPVVAITYPLHDEAGVLRGVLMGAITLSQDQLLLSPSSAGQSKAASFVLLTHEGVIIMHPDSNYITRPLDTLGETGALIAQGMAAPGETLIGPNHEGVRSLYAFRQVPSADWTLVGVAANEAAYASLARLSRHMLLAGALLAALLFPAMWLLVSRMLRPLDYLRNEMRKLRTDPAAEPTDFSASASEELRHLAEDFALMAAAWRAAEGALQQEKERAEVTLESIADGVIATDAQGRIAAINRVAAKIVGWRAEQAIGRDFDQVFCIEDETTGKPLDNVAVQAMKEDAVITSNRTVLRNREGELIPIDNSAAPIHTAHGAIDGAVVVFRNVAAERAAAQQLEWRATHDLMTGLANRAAYENAIERLYASREQDGPHALVMLDLDEFKAVNDSCGHAAGDELLKQLAKLLQTVTRRTDMVARLGGDEFAVLMQSCSADKAMRVAEDLRRTVADFQFRWHERVFHVAASIGVVEIDGSFASVEEVQKAADMACYVAKRNGRNRIVRHSAEDGSVDALRAERSAISSLRLAMEEGRLQLYAQPIVALDECPAMLHFEVLLRLIDTDGRVVTPAAFMPAAERYGLSDELDRWVIAQTVAACVERFGPDRWDELHTVAVNLSAATLRDPRIAGYIAETVERHGMPYAKICFEVTETAAMENPEQVGALMRTLRAKGLRFALDDFGVGMTSLAQLRELPIDVLKIDGAFTRDVHTDSINGAVVEAIQMMAQRLRMNTIAERVEHGAELSYLRALGVDYAQGYLLATPQPIDVVLHMTSLAAASA